MTDLILDVIKTYWPQGTTFLTLAAGLYKYRRLITYMWKGMQQATKSVDKAHIDPAAIRRNNDISNKLRDLRRKLNATRVSVYQFKNGEKFVLSDKIVKIVTAHESVEEGHTFDSSIVNGQHLNDYKDFINPFILQTEDVTDKKTFTTKGTSKVKFTNTSNAKGFTGEMVRYDISTMDWSAFRDAMEKHGTATMYSILIRVARHNVHQVIATLNIQYTDADHDLDLIHNNMEEIKDVAEYLQFALDEDTNVLDARK